MNQRAIIGTMVLCTLAIIAAILGPRFIPRYQEIPGGVVDTWTGDRCRWWNGVCVGWEDTDRMLPGRFYR